MMIKCNCGYYIRNIPIRNKKDIFECPQCKHKYNIIITDLNEFKKTSKISIDIKVGRVNYE